MHLTLVITSGCETCKRVEEQLKKLAVQNKNIILSVVNRNDYRRRGIVIVPALLINDELYSYGDLDEEKLLARLR